MNIKVLDQPDEMNVFVSRRLSTESLIPGITEFMNPTHPKVEIPLTYTPQQRLEAEKRRVQYLDKNQEAELVSDCCSASMWSEQDWHKCNRCGEPCDAVALDE